MSKSQKHQGQVPLTSDDRLDAAMQRYSDLLVDRSCLFNFGEYSNGQQHAQATHGDSILKSKQFIFAMSSAQPACRFKPTQITHALQRFMHGNPTFCVNPWKTLPDEQPAMILTTTT